MFKPIKRANNFIKMIMSHRAIDIANENGWTFTGNIEATKYSTYTVEFESEGSTFYGWGIKNIDPENVKIDFIFGSGQMIDFAPEYVITDEDYYETIGAGV